MVLAFVSIKKLDFIVKMQRGLFKSSSDIIKDIYEPQSEGWGSQGTLPNDTDRWNTAIRQSGSDRLEQTQLQYQNVLGRNITASALRGPLQIRKV